MGKSRITIGAFALIGAFLGVVLGFLAAPSQTWYAESANVALVPPPNLSTAESSSFWEVLTRGQVTRTAAILYADRRWAPSAANAAKVPESAVSISAAALPETTMLSVTVTSSSAAAAEAALNDVLTTATPEVSSLAAPYFVKVIWPQKGSATPLPTPGKTQIGAAGALGGLLVGGAVGYLYQRWRRRRANSGEYPAERMDEAALPR